MQVAGGDVGQVLGGVNELGGQVEGEPPGCLPSPA